MLHIFILLSSDVVVMHTYQRMGFVYRRSQRHNLSEGKIGTSWFTWSFRQVRAWYYLYDMLAVNLQQELSIEIFVEAKGLF